MLKKPTRALLSNEPNLKTKALKKKQKIKFMKFLTFGEKNVIFWGVVGLGNLNIAGNTIFKYCREISSYLFKMGSFESWVLVE